MHRLLASPRRRRRLAWAAAVGGPILGGVVALAVTGGVEPPTETFRAGPPLREERQVPLTAATRRGIDATLDRFVPAAVGRKDPGAAWELAGPGLRANRTRADWLRGDLPVFPYEYRKQSLHGWRLVYAYRDRVAVDLLLQPRPGSRLGPIVFAVDLVRQDGRWLVDSIYPAESFPS